MDDALPRHAQLPATAGAPPGSSWGIWGEDDRLGCLNLLTPERLVAAARLVQTGRTFPLDIELDLVDPPLFGRSPLVHTVLGELHGHGHDDVLDGFNTQSATQWDGFRHIRNPEHGWFGGHHDGFHGIDAWAARGLAGRAVLADVGRWRAAAGRPLDMAAPDPIDIDEVAAVLDAQGTSVEVGDVLLIRTGWVGWYRTLDSATRRGMARRHSNPGLAPGERTAAALWDLGLAAVAADNPSLEVWPWGEDKLHDRLLPLLGMPIGELFDLDALAEDCAADGRYACLFTSAPLRLRAGVASPPGALAIK